MKIPVKHLPLSVRLAMMFGLFLFNYVVFPLFAVMLLLPVVGLPHIETASLGNFTGNADKYIFLFIQGFGSLGAFAFTALLFSQIENGHPFRYLRINIRPTAKFILLALFALLAAQPLVELLVTLTQKIGLPDSLKILSEKGKKELEIENALLQDSSFIRFIANTIVFAVVPAIAEEFFFRGLLLGDLLKAKIKPVKAIIISGFIFSIAHFQFENILAIWTLGMFLGYLYFVSGSIWLPVAAHFTNNFLQVLLKYLFQLKIMNVDLTESSFPLYISIASTIIFFTCIYIFHLWKLNPVFDEPAEQTETETQTIAE